MIRNFIDLFGMLLHGGKERIDLTLEDTVKREVKEETNLDVTKMIHLNWIFKYISLGKECTEYVYVSFVNDGEIILNEESVEYHWCDIDEFIDLIDWEGDKEELRAVVDCAMKGELYFSKPNIVK